MTSRYLRAGCFGKLPFALDFVEAGAGWTSARALTRWIRAGRAVACRAEEDGGDEPVHSPAENRRLWLVMVPEASQDACIGVLRPSHDRGATRRFPFSVFASVPRRPWLRRWGLLPLAAEPVWEALDELWDVLAGVSSESAFREALEGFGIPGPLDPSEAARRLRDGQESRVDRLFEGTAEASPQALMTNLPGLVDDLKGARSGRIVELPTGSGTDEALVAASFWVTLLERPFRWRTPEPSLFLDGVAAASDRGRLLLAYGGVPESLYGYANGIAPPPPELRRPAVLTGGPLQAPWTGESPRTFRDLATTRW